MKAKEKIILSSIILSAGTVFNLFFTAALHGMLSYTKDTLVMIPLRQCISGIFTVKQQGLLFLLFEGFVVLCCILFFVQNNRPYQSDLIQIADDIYTPAPVGQYQHGSARWLTEKEKDVAFPFAEINSNHSVIKRLLNTGYEDLHFGETKEKEEKVIADDKDKKKEWEIKKDSQRKQIEQRVQIIDENFENLDVDIKKLITSNKESQTLLISEKKTNPEKIQEELKSKPPLKDPYKILNEAGLVIGMKREGSTEHIFYIGDDTHTLTIGATRSGKTRCEVLQSICLLALAGESLVISDPKAELFHYTSKFLEKLGYEVICIDFKNPEKSTRYNLLQPIIDAVNKGDMEKAETYAWDITNILVGDNVSNEKIWENGEKSTIAAAILCVVCDNRKRPEFQNLTNVYWFIAEMTKSVGGKTPMQEYVKKLKPDHPARALLSISDVAPSRTKGSFYTSALTTLRLFTGKSIYAVTHTSDYDIGETGQKKQALYFILPDEKTTYYPIASLMVSQLYEILVRQSDERGGRLLNRVNFILDEFGNFTKLNDFPNKLTVAGGRGIRFNLFLQSFEQLTEKYNKEIAAIVKSNCQTWVYLQADDKETLQDICDKLGKYTTSAYQLSSQHGKYVNPSSSHSVSLVARDLLTTDEIRRIKRPNQIVVSRSHPAMMDAPDISQWYFNQMCGLGDKEHNRKVRETREKARPVLSPPSDTIPLWNIWIYYSKELQMKEEKEKAGSMKEGAGAIFSDKMIRKGGRMNFNEEE